jgi:hypothetical protein
LKFLIFYETSKIFNDFFHGRTMAMAAMNMISAGGFSGVSLHLRTKLDNLTVFVDTFAHVVCEVDTTSNTCLDDRLRSEPGRLRQIPRRDVTCNPREA